MARAACTGSSRRRLGPAALLTLLVAAGGCAGLDLNLARRAAGLASYASGGMMELRHEPRNPLSARLGLLAKGGPKPSERTIQQLRRLDLEKTFDDEPRSALAVFRARLAQRPNLEDYHAVAELAYVEGRRADLLGRRDDAMEMYATAVAHAYLYLFDERLGAARNPFDPAFRGACDLYNGALEGALRIAVREGKLTPGAEETFRCGEGEYAWRVVPRGRWRAEEFERFEFASDYQVTGLTNQYRTYGLGAPLIAVRRRGDPDDPMEKHYPPGLTFPVTAFLRIDPGVVSSLDAKPTKCECVLELYDPLDAPDVVLAGTNPARGPTRAPLESDFTTPLAYYLNDPLIHTNALATLALLDADLSQGFQRIYLLEPYDPAKIPVLMVHGLWSSPVTWTEMFNDLRADPDVRRHYQFWFYLYPTGQPFWVSATQLRRDLAELRATVDPQHEAAALDAMVLVGHSMGGLVAKMQAIDSGDRFWSLVSTQPFSALKTDEETRAALATALFVRPNPAIRRIVTIATPHRGSDFANNATRWISHQLFKLPSRLIRTNEQLARDNPDFFVDDRLLKINTSIDSLAPDSPLLAPLRESPLGPGVTHHNIVGVRSRASFYAAFTTEGDGIVAKSSAHLDDVASEIEVDADHTTVHQHPRAVLEVDRILREHLEQSRIEYAQRQARLAIRQFAERAPTGPLVGPAAPVSYDAPASASLRD